MSADIPRLITNLKLVRDDSHVMHHPAIEEVIAKLVEMEGDARRYHVLRRSVLSAPMSAGFEMLTTEADIDSQCDQIFAAIDAASGERK